MPASSGSRRLESPVMHLTPANRGLAANLRRWAPGYLFILPAVAVLTVMTVYPSLALLRLSLTDWKLTGDPKFIGLRNYVAFFQLPASYFAISNAPPGGMKSLAAAWPGTPFAAAMIIAAGYPTVQAGASFVTAMGGLFAAHP